MAPQKLSSAHEVAFYEREGLFIRETFGYYESVALTREEVAALRALITPKITDEQVDDLVKRMNDVFVQRLNESHQSAMRRVVRDWLAALNQPLATSN